jgi:serine/threonine protein kinase
VRYLALRLLRPGHRLGSFEILASIGVGGMGEVYKARDTRLDRTVAIKVIPERLAGTPEARGRFEREARAISQLAHPNICTLFDVGSQDGTEYLVMELLEGETLAERLSKGPLPLDQVLTIGAEIADALGFAHRRGVVHRDLKPGNVMLTKSGAKLLDFGLAKLQAPVTPTGIPSHRDVRTDPEPLTLEGIVVGTPQYMAPEQLRGEALDPRSDIFALGALLYEMASGRRAFAADSQADAIAQILASQPGRDAALERLSPPAFDRLVKRCLARDPDARWQNASDLAIELRWIAEGGEAPVPVHVSRSRGSRIGLGLASLFVLLVLLGGSLFVDRTYFRTPDRPNRPVRLSFAKPNGAPYVFFDHTVVSRDGRQLVFIGYTGDGKRQLWVRSLDSLVARQLPGTLGALFPFWSPDGRSLGFFAEGKLQRIDVENGTPVALCDAPQPNGGSWSREDVIVFSTGGLQRIPAAGGKPVEFLPLAAGEEAYRWPSFLPDGRHFVFLRDSYRTPDHFLRVGSIDSDRAQDLIQVVSNGIVTASGELLYARGGALLAQPFDLERLVATGVPTTLVEHNVSLSDNHLFEFSASDTGVLTYRSVAPESQLTWFDRAGKRLGTVGEAAPIVSFDLAPDGSRVVFDMLDADGRLSDLWLLDVTRGLTSRFTFDHAINNTPRWSRDGERIAFGCSRQEKNEIYQRAVAAPHKEELLLSMDTGMDTMSGMPDGRILAWTRGKMWALSPGHEPEALGTGELEEYDARISEDGHWLAYRSNESGKSEVYVESFPGLTGKHRVSTSGARDPHWSKDGKELFFTDMTGRAILSVKIETHPAFSAGPPTELFQVPGAYGFAVAPDGQRFLINVSSDDLLTSPLTVVIDWTAAIKR